MQQIREGFTGQQMVVLPCHVRDQMRRNKIINGILITDIGYYPHAQNHYRERKKGSSENILIYCTDGSGWFESMNQRYIIEKHTVCIIPSGIPHKYGATSGDPWTIYWMHLEGDKATIIAGREPSIIKLKPEQPEVYLNRIRVFDEIINNFSIPYNLRNLEYANMLVWSFLASIIHHEARKKSNLNRNEKLIEITKKHMQTSINTRLSLKELANHSGLSVSHFSSIFKGATSITPMTYFIHLKIQKSCQLLENSTKRIKEIALEMGFDDPLYYSRVFNKTMGLSPSEFRKVLLGNK